MKTTKTITKLLAFALVLCMAVSMFASCGSNDTLMTMTIDGTAYTLTEQEFSLLMTIKKLDYEKVMALPKPKRRNPIRPNIFWRVLIYLLTFIGMAGTKFTYETVGGFLKNELIMYIKIVIGKVI